jgi:hypothetical protein
MPRSQRWLPAFVLALFSCVMLAIVAGSGYAGMQSGQREAGIRRTATANFLTIKRFQDGVQLLNDGKHSLAQANFEEVLQRQPGNNGARNFLATAIAAQQPSAVVPTATPNATATPPIDKAKMLARARDAYERDDLDETIALTEQLTNIDASFERQSVEEMRYYALVKRGLERVRGADDQVESGLFDLNIAASIATLADDVEGERRLAQAYLSAISYLGADWDRAIFLLQQLPQGYKRVGQRIYRAYVQAGDQYAAQENWCEAERKYASAIEVASTEKLQTQQREALQKCTLATPTPGGPAVSAGGPPAGINSFPGNGLSGRISFSLYDSATGLYRPFAYDTASGTVSRLASEFSAGSIYAPDGTRYVDSIYQDNAWQLTVRSSAGATVIAAGTAPQWGPAGLIAYQGCTDLCGIHAINPDQPAAVQRLTASGSDIAFKWSPQGDRLVYMSNYAGPYELYTASLSGDFRQLTGFGASTGAPAWSPDGTRIAFLSNRDGGFALFVINADGSGLQKLVDFGALTPAWQSARLSWER